MKKKGISLIVLVITIIVIIIIAGAIILNLSKNNPIESAKKAKFLNDIDTFKSELSLYELGKMAGTDGNYDPKLLNADKTGSTDGENTTITDIITSMDKTRYPDILEVVAGELVYVGNNQDESNWSDGVIEVKDFKINISVIPDTTHFSGTISLTGMMVDVNKIDYYKVYLSTTSGEHGDTPAQEIKKKETPVDFNITEGVEPNKTYYIIVEVKMSNESNVRIKEVKVNSSIDSTAPNTPLISLSNYSKELLITPVAITLIDNEGGSGINKTGSKYIIDQNSANYAEDDNIWQAGAINLTSGSFIGDVASLGIEVPSDGEYYIHVLSVDNAGNKKSSTSSKVIVDTIVPNEAEITIPTSTTTGSVDATVLLSDNESGSGINLTESKYIYSTVSSPYGDTEPIWNSATVFTKETERITLTSSTNEIYYLHVLLVDKAGNRREVLSSGVTTNTDIPVAPTIIGTTDTNVWTNQNVTLTVNEVTSPGITRYEYSINGGNWQTYNSTNKIVITSSGTTTVKARAVNNVGVNGAESTGYIVKIDQTNPSVSFGTNGASNVAVATTTVILNDSESGINTSTLKYVWSTSITEPNNGWSTFNNGATLTYSTDGTYYLWIKANDNAGNPISIKSNAFTIFSEYNSVKGVNKPKLVTGMTPIKWDSNGNLIATTESDTDWYDYTNKKWANARTADGSMWVWIPRYEYKITTPHTTTAQTISVNFIQATNTSATSGYIMHPAFTFGTTELTGIWVAKFRASGSTTSVSSLPSARTMILEEIAGAFNACRNMEAYYGSKYGWGTSGSGIDTHLTKNIEYGAILYLSQSTYGINSNIEKNINTQYYTGGGSDSTSYILNTSQSTTGNVFGIYDMNGPYQESVSAYIGALSTSGQYYTLASADIKYKDVYVIGSTDSYTENYEANSGRKGDAVYEVSASPYGTTWYLQYSSYPTSYDPIFTRGSHYASSSSYGAFSVTGTDGDYYSKVTFRPVLVVGNGL